MFRASMSLVEESRLQAFALVLSAVFAAVSGPAALAADTPKAVGTPWRKTCFNDQRTGFRKVCDIRTEVRKADNALLASVELIDREDDPKKILRVTFPLGMQLVPGTRLIVYGIDVQTSGFSQCTAEGCISDYQATPALIGCLRNGRTMNVQAIDQNGKPVDVTISLSDFWVVYDGRRSNDS